MGQWGIKLTEEGTTFFIEDSYPKFSIFWRGTTRLVDLLMDIGWKMAIFEKNSGFSKNTPKNLDFRAIFYRFWNCWMKPR